MSFLETVVGKIGKTSASFRPHQRRFCKRCQLVQRPTVGESADNRFQGAQT